MKSPRCASCQKRIRDHHSDVEVLNVETGRRRYYHQECGGVAYAEARTRGGLYVATYRHAELSAN